MHFQQTKSSLLDNASSHFKPSGYLHAGNHKGAQVRLITLCARSECCTRQEGVRWEGRVAWRAASGAKVQARREQPTNAWCRGSSGPRPWLAAQFVALCTGGSSRVCGDLTARVPTEVCMQFFCAPLRRACSRRRTPLAAQLVGECSCNDAYRRREYAHGVGQDRPTSSRRNVPCGADQAGGAELALIARHADW